HFELTDQQELLYSFKAITDKPTIVNLTHHSYFNFHNGKGQISDYHLHIDSEAWLEQDNNFVTTGQLIPVANSTHDFRSLRPINVNWDPEMGFDQSFVRTNHGIDQVAAEVCAPDAGIRMELFTTEPVVHLYTAKSLG